MNESDTMQQPEEEEAPRRSSRERKQVISVYMEAERAAAASSKTEKRQAANSSGSERSSRSRKRKQEEEEEEEEFDDEDIGKNEEDEDDYSSDDEDLQADADSSDDEDGFIDSEGDNRVKPAVHSRYFWNKPTEQSSFQTVDGVDKLFRTSNSWWNQGIFMSWDARGVLTNGQRALVSKQKKRTIALERVFGRSLKLTQVPYHPELLPSYEYFAEGIQRHTSLDTFKIINYHLPPTPWLGNSVIPSLRNISTLNALELSNCGLSAADISSLVDFLANNTSLSTFNLSHTSIESEDTAKALAKALKKHPAICNVNLAYCSLAGGSAIVDKILSACKNCDSLEIGHEDFDKESVAVVAKFIGKKNSVTSFALKGVVVDKDNKKLLSDALVKNKTIESLCMHSNQMQLPGIILNTKKMSKSLSRLTRLDLSHNKLPVSAAKQMGSFIESKECKLITLIMSANRLTSKGGDILMSALKKNTTLQHLDLSNNWLADQCSPAIIDMLRNNSTLLEFDLTGNKSLKTVEKKGRYIWTTRERIPHVDGGRAKIVKGALFDTTSLDSIAASNHTCAVYMTGFDHNDSYEETIRKINALDANDSAKIRYKLLLAINHANTDLYNPRSFDKVPLELMPCLLEMLQQGIGYNGFGKDIAPKRMLGRKSDRKYRRWNPLTRKRETSPSKNDVSLSRLYEVITSWQSLPQLFARGPGVMKVSPKTKAKSEKKTSKPRKRRKFGDESDDEDEAWIPKGARRRGQWKWNPQTRKTEYIPPPVY